MLKDWEYVNFVEDILNENLEGDFNIIRDSAVLKKVETLVYMETATSSFKESFPLI